MKNVTSMWGPSLVVTKNNTIVAFGECDRSPTSHDGWIGYRRSHDGGSTWDTAQTLYGCGSPAGLYSRSTDTILVFFGECGPPKPKGAPYALSAMDCKGGSTHWQYDTTTKHLRNDHIAAPGSPLGVEVCEAAVKPVAGDSLAVDMAPNQAEPCPPEDLKWTVDSTTGYVRHDNTGLCLTIPPKKSAVLQPCGANSGEGQKYVFNNDTLSLAAGMFRSGECLGYINKTATEATNTNDKLHDSGDTPPAAHLRAQYNLCAAKQNLYCNATRFRNTLKGYPECKSCLQIHAHTLKTDDKCTADQMSAYCGGPVGPAPRVGPKGEKTPPSGSGIPYTHSPPHHTPLPSTLFLTPPPSPYVLRLILLTTPSHSPIHYQALCSCEALMQVPPGPLPS
jgi:hypothetical protein